MLTRRALALLPLPAFAQTLTDRPVRVISPFAPGGSDLFARILAQDAGRVLGRSMLVENRSGAGGNVGTEAVVRAPADGHTLLYTTASITINPALYARMTFDAARDLVALNLVCAQPHIIVAHPGSGIRSLAGALAMARSRRDGLTYASSGSGTSGHLTMEWLAQAAGVPLTHVPYRGAGQSANALIAGETQLGVSVGPVLRQHILEGRLVALATTGPERLAMLPTSPTLVESGFPGLVTEQWHATFAPAATPSPLQTLLADAFAQAIAQPAFAARVADEGGRIINTQGAAIAPFLVAEREKWARLVRQTGATAD